MDRDEYLDRVLIGGRERRAIVLVEYDPEWPRRFEVERRRIRAALDSLVLRIEHIGSTAVPGLAAKPIVDILVGVEDADDEKVFGRALEAAGYELRVREPGHRMFRTPARDVHVHVWNEIDPEVARHLRFRNRLRVSAEDRREYERVKRELVSQDWADMNDYADAKTEVIQAILARAEAGSPADPTIDSGVARP